MNETWLAHHGIKGQKWGVRRFQNADGTLTAAGRKRYGEDLDIEDKSGANVAKIRLGETRRKLDEAKSNNANSTEIARLKNKEREAKVEVRNQELIQRGEKQASKGNTVGHNFEKAAIAGLAAITAYSVFNNAMKQKYIDYTISGKSTDRLVQIHGAGKEAVFGLLGMYGMKLYHDNRALRAYNASKNG